MLGLLMMLIVGVYCVFWIWVAKRFESKLTKWLIALIAVLIPIWDYIPQQICFHQLCKAEAGQHFHAEPVVVDGFYDEGMGFEGAKRFVEHGYRYIETYGYDAGETKLMRVERNAQGVIAKTLIDAVTSRYEFQGFSEDRPWALSAGGTRVVDRSTGKVLVASVGIYQGPTWIIRALVPREFPSSGDPCFGVNDKESDSKFINFLTPPTNNDRQTEE